MDHILQDFLGRIETERGGIADIQLDDVLPFLLHLPCAVEHRAADVITDIRQLAGFQDGAHGWENVIAKGSDKVPVVPVERSKQ